MKKKPNREHTSLCIDVDNKIWLVDNKMGPTNLLNITIEKIREKRGDEIYALKLLMEIRDEKEKLGPFLEKYRMLVEKEKKLLELMPALETIIQQIDQQETLYEIVEVDDAYEYAKRLRAATVTAKIAYKKQHKDPDLKKLSQDYRINLEDLQKMCEKEGVGK